MRRGTTDCLEFEMPYSAAFIENGYVTITQLGNVIRDDNVKGNTVILADGVIKIPLSQEDTLAFPTGAIKMSIRLRLSDGSAVASDDMYTTVDDVEKGGVI